MRVLIIHAYSSDNAGDGLLVEDSIRIARKALGSDAEITVLASHPRSFSALDATVLDSGLHWFGYSPIYLSTLFRIRYFDRVIAVGGGYLRAGTCLETIKTALIHGPQLLAAASRGSGVVYLPQSVGPARFGLRTVFRALLGRMDKVFLRDERSIDEFHLPNAARVPDLAAAAVGSRPHTVEVDQTPVLSIRKVRGELPPLVRQLSEQLSPFDVYVQSKSSGNDDRAVSALLPKRSEVAADDFLSAAGPRRVVVAVRLHAALMALQAGHFVIHLAYERKGFGAYADLGLDEYVHNVNNFSVDAVLLQVANLTNSIRHRESFRAAISATEVTRQEAMQRCIAAVHSQPDFSLE
jgi:polysaccharide pyruvyl transferase WcaK-like protein